MSEESKVRVSRTKEERVSQLDKKIAFHAKMIDTLMKKKEKIGLPRKKRVSFATIFAELKKSGKSPEEIKKMFEDE